MDRQKQNEAREKLKKDLHKSIGKSKEVLIELPTGTGKTGIALEQAIIQSPKALPTLRFYVPETTNIISIKKEIEDRGYQYKFKDIDVLCYRSIHLVEEPADVTIYDETHHLFGEKTFEHYLKNRGEINIYVSATIDEEQHYQLKQNTENLKKYSKTTDEVVDMGILPESSVYIWRVEVDDTKKKYEVKYGSKTYKVTAKGKLDKFAKDIRYFMNLWDTNKKKNGYALTRVKNIGSERKRFIASLKTDIAKELMENIQGRRIVFCGSVKQSQEIGGKKYSIVGTNKKKDNEKKFNDFNNRKIDVLTTVGKLQESVNLVDCQSAVLVQLGNQAREFIQKRGRVLRVLEPIVHIIVVNDSKDEDFLDTTMTHINHSSIKGDYIIRDLYDVKPHLNNIYGILEV